MKYLNEMKINYMICVLYSVNPVSADLIYVIDASGNVAVVLCSDIFH